MAAGAARVALVTGGASGIGRATVELLAGRGYGVVALDRRADGFGWVPDGAAVVPLAGDVTDEAVNALAVATALDRFGGLDVAVLNAGVPGSGPIETVDMAVFDATYQVNVRAVALGIRAVIGAMRDAGGGSIVVTASTAGLGGEQRRWPYNTSKAAVINLVRAAAIDLALDGIRVNAVCPGPVHSGMTEHFRGAAGYDDLRRMIPQQRWGDADEVAQAIAFLASPEASFITGTALPVDGGISAGNGHSLPPQGAGRRRDR
jgi:3-oxoacyl-[acyl-carrier protein] reductase